MAAMQEFFSTPRPAATVVVVRGAKPVPEILMLRRHSRAVFASYYVFPGGVLDACDREFHELADGAGERQCNALLGIEHALDYFSAAIREAFEEAGVLFARDADDRWAFTGDDIGQPEIDACRRQLNDGSLSWDTFLQHYALRPAYDALTYIAHWVTPRVPSKRFSTRFFLAVLPDGQHASHDDGELTHSCWMTAADALAAGKRSEIKLMYPTYSTLREITACHDVSDVLSWARGRADSGVARLLPAWVTVNGKDKVVMPDDPLYPEDFDT